LAYRQSFVKRLNFGYKNTGKEPKTNERSFMNLQPFLFPVVERPVYAPFEPNQTRPLIPGEPDSRLVADEYKMLVRQDTNTPISIVRKSYQVVENEEVIGNLLKTLMSSGMAFRIDASHSFVDNQRMRLQVLFPELTIEDSESSIALSLFLHNSYDMSEGVRISLGALRQICTNGMTIRQTIREFYGKHTKGFAFDGLNRHLEQTKKALPLLQAHVSALERQRVTEQTVKAVEENISKRLAKQVIEEHEINRLSQWKLLNRITHFISHDLEQPLRAKYQDGVATVFGL
jgi:signal transduction histidine kinase